MRYEKNYSSHTVLSYKNDLEQFSAYLEARTGGEVDLPSADMSLVRGFVSSLMEDGMSARSAGRKLSSLRTFYKYLIKEGRIAVSPVDGVSKPRGGKRLPVFVKQSDMDAILDAPDADGSFCDVRDRLVVSMLYHTGMRRAELIALRDEDVDIVSMTLKVTGKRNKQRIIPFGEELKTEIEEYLRLREETTGVSRPVREGERRASVPRSGLQGCYACARRVDHIVEVQSACAAPYVRIRHAQQRCGSR